MSRKTAIRRAKDANLPLCPATLQFCDPGDSGMGRFHCQGRRGHLGSHYENGRTPQKIPYYMEWGEPQPSLQSFLSKSAEREV